jgi:hypothetical protein
MEQKLKEVFSTVNDFLKFAEAKNGALIAFNSGAVWASLSFLKDCNDTGIIFTFSSFALMNIVSLIIAFWSFIAITDNTTKGGQSAHHDDNLAFFGHIAKLHEDELIKAISTKYNIASSNESIEKDIANQIVINSRITLRKFKLFNTAIKLTLASIFISVIIYITYYFHCNC